MAENAHTHTHFYFMCIGVTVALLCVDLWDLKGRRQMGRGHQGGHRGDVMQADGGGVNVAVVWCGGSGGVLMFMSLFLTTAVSGNP